MESRCLVYKNYSPVCLLAVQYALALGALKLIDILKRSEKASHP
jgi:hypothetical protein